MKYPCFHIDKGKQYPDPKQNVITFVLDLFVFANYKLHCLLF